MLLDHRIQLGHHFIVWDKFTPIGSIDPRLDERAVVRLALCNPAYRLRSKFAVRNSSICRQTVDERSGLTI